MPGLQITCELRDCPVQRAVMTDPGALGARRRRAAAGAGLLPAGEPFHRCAPSPQAPPAAQRAPAPRPVSA